MNALRRRSPSTILIAATIVAVVAVVASWAVIAARPFDQNAVVSAAMNALSQQYVQGQSPDTAAHSTLFSGSALTALTPVWDQQNTNINAGQDYPGVVDETNPVVLAISGTSSSVVVDLQVHERLHNMNAGKLVDYSESDVIYHLTLDNTNARWVISSLDWSFAPGSEP